jgi:hypothetical protein
LPGACYGGVGWVGGDGAGAAGVNLTVNGFLYVARST